MNDISELFDRDPLLLSDQDVYKIVQRLRENQAQYELGVKAPVTSKHKKASKAESILKDLGL